MAHKISSREKESPLWPLVTFTSQLRLWNLKWQSLWFITTYEPTPNLNPWPQECVEFESGHNGTTYFSTYRPY
jgi:hypothetical protein